MGTSEVSSWDVPELISRQKLLLEAVKTGERSGLSSLFSEMEELRGRIRGKSLDVVRASKAYSAFLSEARGRNITFRGSNGKYDRVIMGGKG